MPQPPVRDYGKQGDKISVIHGRPVRLLICAVEVEGT
jgi:hypothetical protein